MCFISQDPKQPSKGENPILAMILNGRGPHINDLLIVRWRIRDRAIQVIAHFLEPGPLAHTIVEVPRSYGFAFVFRIGDAMLMDLRDPEKPYYVYRTSFNPYVEEQHLVKEFYDEERLKNIAGRALLELFNCNSMHRDSDNDRGKQPFNHVCSWCWEPVTGKIPKMVVCVDTGEFFMIEIASDSSGIKFNLSERLYKGPSCKALVWVEGGFLSAFGEMGDGMVLKAENGSLVYTSRIQNIAPILDISVVDYHDAKCDQMFACCGVAPEGSLRIIRSGISVEKLLRTAPIYQGITGTWTIRMKVSDPYHSFLVLSFVEETRVLRVGLSFTDVTDSVGFQPDICTLACGLVDDGLVVQVHQNAVRLCLPTKIAHSGGIPLSYPVCTSWFPEHASISLGAVAHKMIIVSTSNPCFLFILGVRSISVNQYEIYEMQHLRFQTELSCISIPQKRLDGRKSNSPISLVGNRTLPALPVGVNIGYTFVIGTHRPSVEVLSFLPKESLRVVASGTISLTNTTGTAGSSCIPQDVKLVLGGDRFYILAGLRNGMVLRFEWPSASNISSSVMPNYIPSSATFRYADTVLSNVVATNSFGSQISAFNFSEKSKHELPINLQLIATRRIGITPVFLVPLSDSPDSDMIAISDRPWLLQSARHSLAYTSISFQPATHATPVCSVECPEGILFVADNCLNLVEMVHGKRLNPQNFHLGGTPRKVLYHSESRLLVMIRTELSDDTCSSDICCVDPLSGSVVSCFELERGETGKSMELVRAGNEQVLVVGTSLSSGPAMMPSGECEMTKGRLIVLFLERVQNSGSGSMTIGSKAGSSFQRTSPVHEIIGYSAEQCSSSSPCSTSCDGIKLEETEAWQLQLAYSTTWPGIVLAICPYLDHNFLASAGNAFYVCSFPNGNPQRVRRLAVGRTRFIIMLLSAHFSRIAVGDCRDGVLFYYYDEGARKLKPIYCDPSQRLVADCVLLDVDTAVVSDRKGSIAVLSCSDLEDNPSPERNLTLSCAYHMGEVAMRIRKGSLIYKLPANDALGGCDNSPLTNLESLQTAILATTLLGSIVILIPISNEEYEVLEAVQARVAAHPLTAPLLGNDHNEFRGRENPAGVPRILDGDMLAQFLELTSMQQEAILASPFGSRDTTKPSLKLPLPPPIGVNQVVQLLERVHYALN